MKLNELPSLFGISSVYDISPFGTGHINSTYHVVSAGGEYILQAINRNVFHDPGSVMNNISLIVKAFADTGSDIGIPEYLSANGRNYAVCNGEFWRMYRYIKASPVTENSDFLSGCAFGSFIRITDGLKLQPVIEGYHDIDHYFKRFIQLSKSKNTDAAVIQKLSSLNDTLKSIFSSGIPLRCIHGDAKADNVITGDKCTIIDLDTAMQGFAALDYGDLIRSVCRSGKTSPERISRITQGFAKGLGGVLTASEIDSLYYGILWVTAELAIRYLTDYISGERYFRDKTPEECLKRSDELLSQLDMFTSNGSEIKNIIQVSFSKTIYGGDHAVQSF